MFLWLTGYLSCSRRYTLFVKNSYQPSIRPRLRYSYFLTVCSQLDSFLADIQFVVGTSSLGPCTSSKGLQHVQNNHGHASLLSQSTSSETTKSSREKFQDVDDVLECSSCKQIDDVMVSLQVCCLVCNSSVKMLHSSRNKFMKFYYLVTLETIWNS